MLSRDKYPSRSQQSFDTLSKRYKLLTKAYAPGLTAPPPFFALFPLFALDLNFQGLALTIKQAIAAYSKGDLQLIPLACKHVREHILLEPQKT